MKEKADNTYPFIQNKDFNGTTINMDTDFFIPISVAEKFPNIVLDRPSLLISISGRIGNVGFYSCVHKAFIGGAVGICKLKYNDDGKFIIHELESEYGQKYFHLLIKASSHANITVEDIRNMELIFPNKKEEKVCISTFFSTLDNLITLHQSKSFGHILKVIVSCTLSWEQRKVGAICSISTGKSNTQDRVEDGKYPFYVRSSIVERSNRYLFDEEAVLTVGDGVGTGKVFHYVDGKYDLHQRVYRMFDFEKDISAKYFFYYLSKNFYDRVMAMTAKTSVDSVRYEVIADMDIIVPHIKEQKFIADIFQNFDYLITLHQSKLEKLKKIKKSMLESMFV